ncbi:MAG: hypothetical protein EBU15_15060 [Betaproteobacteria bacterium]|nr:hypothetical protein [Betaproteobacteria bacterium]
MAVVMIEVKYSAAAMAALVDMPENRAGPVGRAIEAAGLKLLGAFYINGTNKAIFLADGSLEDGNTIGVMALAAGPFDKAQEYFRRAAKVKAIYRKPGEARK